MIEELPPLFRSESLGGYYPRDIPWDDEGGRGGKRWNEAGDWSRQWLSALWGVFLPQPLGPSLLFILGGPSCFQGGWRMPRWGNCQKCSPLTTPAIVVQTLKSWLLSTQALFTFQVPLFRPQPILSEDYQSLLIFITDAMLYSWHHIF